MQNQTEKVREGRLRRMAARQGYRLEKCRRRDPLAPGYGTCRLVEADTGTVVYGAYIDAYGLDLDEIEAILADAQTRKEGN
jgi:hypothetical protein